MSAREATGGVALLCVPPAPLAGPAAAHTAVRPLRVFSALPAPACRSPHGCDERLTEIVPGPAAPAAPAVPAVPAVLAVPAVPAVLAVPAVQAVPAVRSRARYQGLPPHRHFALPPPHRPVRHRPVRGEVPHRADPALAGAVGGVGRCGGPRAVEVTEEGVHRFAGNVAVDEGLRQA